LTKVYRKITYKICFPQLRKSRQTTEKKPLLQHKQGFVGMQTWLLRTPKKPGLPCKEALFGRKSHFSAGKQGGAKRLYTLFASRKRAGLPTGAVKVFYCRGKFFNISEAVSTAQASARLTTIRHAAVTL